MPQEKDIQMEPAENTPEQIVENLAELNKTVISQRSFSRVFVMGMVYGVGFVIGSSVLAVFILGVLSHIFGDLPIVQYLLSYIQQ